MGRIETKKIDFTKKAKPKVNSFSNIGHVPGGGRVKVMKNNETSTIHLCISRSFLLSPPLTR